MSYLSANDIEYKREKTVVHVLFLHAPFHPLCKTVRFLFQIMKHENRSIENIGANDKCVLGGVALNTENVPHNLTLNSSGV